MLEEDEQSTNYNDDAAVHAGTSTADDNRVSHSPKSCQQSSFDRNSIVQRDSLEDDSIPASVSTDIQSGGTRTASTDRLDEDPWLPLLTAFHSPINSSTRDMKSPPSSHLVCCNNVLHSAVGCHSENVCSERCTTSSYLQCRCGEELEERLQEVPETCTVNADEVMGSSDTGLQHDLAVIKEEAPKNCFDTERGTNHPSSTDCVHRSFMQSDLDQFRSTRAEDSSGYSHPPSSGMRPVRRASLNGLRKAVRSVLVHRTSVINPANDSCHLPIHSFASDFTDHCSVPDAAEKFKSVGSKGTSKVNRRHYFGSGRRSDRSGLGVDSVRQSLTHLLRTADHGSSVIGERMAAGCMERPVSSTLTLVSRSRRALSGNFDDIEETETCRVHGESSQTDDQSDAESETLTTSTCLSELDTNDSFYEARLFDALEAPENIDVGDGDFETDSSDDGTYSAESFSDLVPSDDQPISSTSSHGSVDVDDPSNGRVPPQNGAAVTGHIRQGELGAPDNVTSQLLLQTGRHRPASGVNSHRLTVEVAVHGRNSVCLLE